VDKKTDDLVILITGASRGLGRGIVRCLLEYGFKIFAVARSLERLEELKLSITGELQSRLEIFDCDVRDHSKIKEAVQACIDRYHRLDILINNAALRVYGGIEEIEVQDWLDAVNTNINGYFFFAKECLPWLKNSPNSWIFNIGSTAGRVPFQGGISYNTTKGAVHAFSESLILDIRRMNVRVCNIIPSNIWNKDFTAPVEEKWMLDPNDIGEVILKLFDLDKKILISSIEVRPTVIPDTPEKGIRMLRYI
jgi:3-oxoacyl-[acyl-carrier protein] reductase